MGNGLKIWSIPLYGAAPLDTGPEAGTGPSDGSPRSVVFSVAAPEALAAASADSTGIGEAIREATAAAAPSTTSVVAAAEDEVSAAISKLFGGYGQEFQALSAQAGQFHSSFVQSLTSGGNLYASAEASAAATVAAFTDVGGASFSPFLMLTGRALFGNGVAGATGVYGTGANGGNGGAGGIDSGAMAASAGPAGPVGPTRLAVTVVTAGPGVCGALAVPGCRRCRRYGGRR